MVKPLKNFNRTLILSGQTLFRHKIFPSKFFAKMYKTALYYTPGIFIILILFVTIYKIVLYCTPGKLYDASTFYCEVGTLVLKCTRLAIMYHNIFSLTSQAMIPISLIMETLVSGFGLVGIVLLQCIKHDSPELKT